MKKDDAIALRLRRQFLDTSLKDEPAYTELFRRCQPVSTLYFTRPGAPPTLAPRTAFDDSLIIRPWRSERKIVKGRFLGGTIGYVLAEELELYATAFHKPINRLTDTQQRILDALQSCGPLPPRFIKEETGILNKHIMPALHRLQTACIVYEDQLDDDWERPWSLFEAEWPDVNINPAKTDDATDVVLCRFLELNVFATVTEIRDWSRLSSRRVTASLGRLVDRGLVVQRDIEGMGSGYVCLQDVRATMELTRSQIPVHILHRADPLTRSHVTELKERFGKTETLQYLLIEGELLGAVLGHWRIGPHDVDDIRLEVPVAVRKERKDEIIAEVSRVYHPPNHAILRYDGTEL